ncbi:hypothetical protein NHX12_009817 [Muraenolepis orangiensis]|uniref:Drebrin n=1 Tax=Muraenolepis orangiensis TaxID=630683 RepID=A0A9Q0DL22_9TELE|nr:hypothetical protein NHX12_009817 [Muraenolepis orangiensis]
MAVNLGRNRLSLLTSYQEVIDEASDTDWALYSYDGDGDDLTLASSGAGGLLEISGSFESSRVMYGFCSIKDPSSALPRYVLINWVGEDVPDARKCACASHVSTIADFFQGVNVIINASNMEDVEPSAIGQRLTNGTTAVASPVLSRLRTREEENGENVGTVYQKTNAEIEMKKINREEFWEKAKREEELRKEEEKKRAAEERQRFEEERMELEKKEQEERERRYREREQEIEEQRKKMQDEEETKERLRNQQQHSVCEPSSSPAPRGPSPLRTPTFTGDDDDDAAAAVSGAAPVPTTVTTPTTQRHASPDQGEAAEPEQPAPEATPHRADATPPRPVQSVAPQARDPEPAPWGSVTDSLVDDDPSSLVDVVGNDHMTLSYQHALQHAEGEGPEGLDGQRLLTNGETASEGYFSQSQEEEFGQSEDSSAKPAPVFYNKPPEIDITCWDADPVVDDEDDD